jgi:hypothetical protein
VPPRYAYWTILIDGKPTAFRAREKEELLPTFNQLCRTNKDVVFKWFARGRLWESPEAAHAAVRAPKVVGEKRGRDWRPGGAHADPRAKFKKRPRADARPRRDNDRQPDGGPRERKPGHAQAFRPAGRPPTGPRPWSNKPAGPPRTDRPWRDRPRPWSSKPTKKPKPPERE